MRPENPNFAVYEVTLSVKEKIIQFNTQVCPVRYSKGEMYGDKGGKTPALPQHTVGPV